MRIRGLEITDFGKFKDAAIIDLPKGVVVVYGRNEAGKTTLFHLIKTLIFGFSPAKAENHPYASWKNERIEFKGLISSEEDEEIEIYRRLLSGPSGKMIIGDKVVELRNNPVPIANHVSWEIYNKIYALGVEDLVEIQGKAWDEVQDKLLGNYGNINLKNSRDVIKQLKEETNKIHRESGRGKSEVKELETQIRELKKDKFQAVERQMLLKEHDQRINTINEKINRIIEDKILLKTQLKKAKVLGPIKRRLGEMESLKNKLPNNSLGQDIPQNVGERLREAEDKQQKLQEELEKRKALFFNKKEKQHIFTPEEELIISQGHQIEEYYKLFLKLEGLREENQQLELEQMKLKDRLRHEGRNLLSGEINFEIIQSIKELSIPELRLIITSHEKINREFKEVQGLLQYQQQQNTAIKASNAYGVAGIIGIICILMGLFFNRNPLIILGGIAVVYGVTDWFNGQRIRRQFMKGMAGRNNENQLGSKSLGLSNQLEEQIKLLLEKFKGIPIPPLVLENIQEVFLSNLIKVKDLIFQVEEKEKVLEGKRRLMENRQRDLSSFLRAFTSVSPQMGEQLLHLKKKVVELEGLKSANINLQEDIHDLEESINELEEDLRQLMDNHGEMKETLCKIGEGSWEKGLKIIEENYQTLFKINLIKESLREIPDLDSIVKEIENFQEADSWIFTDMELERAEEKIEVLEENLQILKEEKKELEINIAQLLKLTTIDEIESRLLLLEAELQETSRKRDSLLILSEVIIRAEEIFREENQPDVLKNASKYLDIITGGRYTTIYLEDTQEGTVLLIKEKDYPFPRRVSHSFSKGTMNQLYLSLRLSLIDHLDGKGENLPICLDELLINWDQDRLDNNLRLLKEISSKRQIFMFTCHDWLARKIESTFNTKRIELR